MAHPRLLCKLTSVKASWLGSLYVRLNLATHPKISDGRGDEDGTERTEDDTEGHGKCKALDAAAADEEDAEQHDQRRQRRVDGTCEGLVDGVVKHLLDVLLGM